MIRTKWCVEKFSMIKALKEIVLKPSTTSDIVIYDDLFEIN